MTLMSGIISNEYMLPSEIWEIVITLLLNSPRSIVAASQVCRRWRHLTERICQKYCAHTLEENLLKELLESAITHRKCSWNKENAITNTLRNEWVKIFWMYQETFLDTKAEERFIIYSVDSTCSLSSEDPFLSISTYDKDEDTTTSLMLCALDFKYCEENGQERVTESLMLGLTKATTVKMKGKVLKICLLTLSSPVLLVITATTTKAVMLSAVAGDRDWAEVPFNTAIKAHSKTSSEGSLFVTQDSENGDYLLLYDSRLVNLNQDPVVQLSLKYRFKTEASSYSSILSRGLIRTMETSGHIRSYDVKRLTEQPFISPMSINEEDVHFNESDVKVIGESVMKKDLRYPNPTLFFKDFLFSSTLVSRELLGYWHMDRDRDFWLIGNTYPKCRPNIMEEEGEEISRSPIRLHQVMLGQGLCQVVTAVHLQRGILLCGTKEGHLLGYKMGPIKSSEEECFKDLTDLPWLNITGVATQSICRLASLFTPLGLLVAIGEDNGKSSLLYIQTDSQQ